MRARGAPLQDILLGLALLAGLLWNGAFASEISGLRLESGATGTRAELTMAAETEYKVISLANPDRLVVDLPGVALGKHVTLPAPSGLVRAVRSGQPEPGVTRIVFDLAEPVVALRPRFEPGADGVRLVVEWPGDGSGDPIGRVIARVSQPSATGTTGEAAAIAPASAAGEAPDPAAASREATSRLISAVAPASTVAAATGAGAGGSSIPSQPAPQPAVVAAASPQSPPAAATQQAQTQTPAPAPRAPVAGMRPLVIAIDPGHGGQDPGAVGPTGKREKDITLAIARELGRQIDATPGLRSYLTRDRDVFIPLNRRAQLAREAGADMFISIHADAAHNRNAKGSSVYVLSLRGASSQRARWLADKENAADLIGGVRLQEADDTLASVLLDLTQSGQMKASEDAGSHILDGLKRIGNNHKPHIERANFAVLRTSDMPAMLVETAFLSNPEEEQRLIDPAFQGTVARAVLDGINTYFSAQPPPGTLYAARAAAASGGSGTGAAGGGSP
ncbi:N-acetylmuramoyl-L-alanine amidase [Luteimonas sp. SJ-92]|uniref:N-acetylmuramoyl-L-alanine amidase AmiC n=1 Tax=Luteimonas salinisoli TaxID=2752307 RepID=A0A853J971_9GAMM|nr:N-acetylmuramoyl-L-alanine amidase [Luteimonas salinisoli]NZA25238.1 N-acetylmuramoyl-L-alanine amidase [Luteimonas salinisoli]